MTDAKHEAQAETITSAELIANTDYARGAVRVPGETEDRRIYGQPEAPAEGAGEAQELAVLLDNLVLAQSLSRELREAATDQARSYLYALRARSSAPQAREEALGNLLAVIHGDGGHRALEVGTKQAALEAEKIVANLLSSAPEAREREAVAMVVRKGFSTGSLRYTERGQHADLQDGTKLYTHPAAPSADKLRIAVEALEKIKTGRATVTECSLIARRALAALKAERA